MTERGAAHRSWLRLLVSAAASLALISACAESTVVLIDLDDVASLSVSPSTSNLPIGSTLQISSQPLSSNGALLAGLSAQFVSTSPSVASVDAGGLVTGLASGSTEIVVTVGAFEARARVDVAPRAAIVVTGAPVAFTATAGGADPGPGSVQVTNGGGFPLVGLAVDSVVYGAGATGWLAPALSGSSAPATLTMTPMTAGLTTAGTFTATVWLSAMDADNSPAPIQASLEIEAGPAADLAVDEGDGQTAPAGAAVATPPSALVTDAFGNPVAGASVTFSVASGGGSVTGGVVTTDGSGIARVGSWTLGSATGAQTLGATTSGASAVTFTATATAGAAAQIQVDSGNNQSAVVATAVSLPPAAVVMDSFGNPVPGVDVTFAVVSGGGSITGGAQVTDAAGVAAVGSWTLGSTVGTNTLEATAAGVATATTFTAAGISGAATAMMLSAGDAQTDTVAATLSTAYSVRVVDSDGAGIEGVPVSWTVTGGGGTITTSSNTDASGFATATRVLGTTAGVQTATASVGGLTGSPVAFTATALAGAAAMTTASAGDGQTATVSTAVATAPRAAVQDQFGNPVAGHSVIFQVTAGGGTIAPTTSVLTDASGVASATDWTLGTAAGTGNNTVTATAAGAGLTGNPVTFTASATAGAPASIQVDGGNGQAAIAGVNVATPPSVLVLDQFSNPVPGASITFSPSGSGSVGTPIGTTNGSGIAMSTWAPGSGGAAMGTDGTFANTLTVGVQGTALTVPFSGTASYSYAQHVDPIWASANCLGCHGGTSGLTFPGNPSDNHAAIANVVPVCDGALGTDYRIVSTAGGVQAADDFSILLRMIDTGLSLLGDCDRRMPGVAGGMSVATVDTIRAWIRNGAPNNE